MPPSAPTVSAAYWLVRATAQAAAEALLEGHGTTYALCASPPAPTPGPIGPEDSASSTTRRWRQRCCAKHFARVAILDVDLHHGNGTQDSSITGAMSGQARCHVDPSDFYPFFWGAPTRRGMGEGLGANVNLPLPLGCDGAAFLEALEILIARLEAFRPEAVVVALGSMRIVDDPLAGMTLDTQDFHRGGAVVLGRMRLPVVLVQEGG